MRTLHAIFIAIGLLVAWSFAPNVCAQDKLPLKLVRTIPMPGVQGRLDHVSADVNGKRLFVAALGDNQNTVEVIDLKAGKRVFSVPGMSKPQGIFYSPDFQKLFVANGTDGTCKIFSGRDFKLIDSLPIGADPDHVGYDPATKYLYIGFGDTKSDGLAIIDTRTNKHIRDIKTDGRPNGNKLERSSPRIFSGITGSSKVGVIDRKTSQVIATWPVAGGSLALDESHHRLFTARGQPPSLVVYDTESGKQIAELESGPGVDDQWYDAVHKRIYTSGGRGLDEGFVYVFHEIDADHYESLGKVPSGPGAGTSFWEPQLNRFYVAVPANDKREAAVMVFEPQP